jgi:hypothetical protein
MGEVVAELLQLFDGFLGLPASNDARGSATSRAVKVSVKTRLTASGIRLEDMSP